MVRERLSDGGYFVWKNVNTKFVINVSDYLGFCKFKLLNLNFDYIIAKTNWPLASSDPLGTEFVTWDFPFEFSKYS